MQDYDYTIHHIEGKKNVRADALSRREGEENKRKIIKILSCYQKRDSECLD
jgi:hypothetical protein